MDHMMKPGVLMPSSNLSSVSNIGNNMSSSHHHHRHRVHVTAAGVDVLSPVSSSSSSVTDRCRCTLCNYVGQDDNDLHRHFREVHWQQVLIMHQQRQEVLNGAAKSIIKPSSSQKYALADQPSATSNNMLTSSTDNVELDESIVAAANTILSISASNNAAMQNQRRNTMLDCVSIAKNSNQSTPETSSDFARPRLATLGAVPNNLTNGVYHPGSKDQMIGQVDLPSSEESQLLRKMQLQHPQNLAAIAELAEYSSQVQQPQRVNNFSLELLLQQQQLLLSQQSELNPLRLAALAELRAVLASQLYATLQQQQQQPIASSATAQQTYLPLSQQQQQQNAGCIASAQNFLVRISGGNFFE
uniref:Uncharacterized protein n=1 Tax=Romanomermis culicivorax TaxID=13658 RepID=A0A915ISK0_ROMCU